MQPVKTGFIQVMGEWPTLTIENVQKHFGILQEEGHLLHGHFTVLLLF